MFDQFFQQKAEADQETVENFEYSSKFGLLITAIHVTDLTLQQDGGKVRITKGGIGWNFVKLQLTSERGQQLLLNIEIFGDLK